MQPSSLRSICLTAPTACGKTTLALGLARRIPIEIISMDSAMVYRGMDIGTAKPPEQERAGVPHHLIDILEPNQAYSAGQFVADTARLVRDIQARGRLALIVGGTMMYLKALQGGLDDLPKADRGIRAAIDAEAAAIGWPAVHRRLAAVDPRSAKRIAPHDRQRIQRALEVYRISGTPLSQQQRRSAPPPVNVMTIAVVPDDRRQLRARIAARFDKMLADGLVGEVAVLRSRGDLAADMTSMRSVGYRQIWEYLDGQYDLETARDKAVIATGQLAKRQLTWLRSGLADDTVSADDPALERRILERIERQSTRWA